MVKPLVDGVMAAMCRPDGARVDEVSRRLAGQLAVPAADVTHQLLSAHAAVLGTITLVRPYRDGVMWHPPDDQLVQIDMTVEPSPSDEWSVAGQLHELRARDE